MRPLKLIAVLALLMFGARVAAADDVPPPPADDTDPIIGGQRGPTGSPFLSPVLSLDVNNPVLFTADYTVAGGDNLTAESITVPAADVAKGVTCAFSNAFLSGDGTSPVQTVYFLGIPVGFAPVQNDGTDTCNWHAYTGPNGDPPGLTESVAQMELDCAATNLGLENDPDDCAGIPGGTDNSDIVFDVYHGVTGPDGVITAVSTGVPEPGSLPLLLLGLTGLGIFAYRRKQLLA